MIYKEPYNYKMVSKDDYDELMAEYFGMFENKSTIKDSTFPFGQQWTPIQTHIPHDQNPTHPNTFSYDPKMSWPQKTSPATSPNTKPADKPALELQVGGSHYKDMKIQPMEYILANNLGWAEGNVIKYVTRHKAKGGKQDLEKAIHMLKLIIELEYKDV